MTTPISLRKTGLVVFGARIGSIFTGLIFLVLITRSLSAQEFGLYEVITDIVAFSAYPAGLVAFWATRDIARGKMFGKTAILLNLVISAFGVGIYAVLSYASVTRIPSASIGTLLFAVMLVPAGYLNQASNSVVAGHRPVVLGYAVIFSEASKLLVAIPLLVVYKAGIDGVILAVTVANLAQGVSSALLAGDATKEPVNFQQARKWLTHSWLPMLTTLPVYLGIADTYVASLAAGGTILVAHYQAAYSVAILAGYSLYLASAMYPLLLRGGGDAVTAMTLDLALAFGIPMSVGAAVLATPILHILNVNYLDASTALEILSFSALVFTVSSVFDTVLLGKDRVDVDESAGFGSYLRSNILYVAKIDIAMSAAYIASVYASVTVGLSNGWSTATIIDTWAAAQLCVFTFFVLVKTRRVRAAGKLVFPRSLGYYIVGALAMAAILYVLRSFIVFGRGTFFLALEIVVIGGVGVLAYGAIVLALDKTLRDLIRRALRENFG